MTPRERIQTAMELSEPDRVPFMCQLSIGHMLLQLGGSPAEFWHDPRVFADGLVRLRDIYDFDGILVSLHGHDPNWQAKIDHRRKTEEGEIIVWKNGDQTLYPADDLPQHQRSGKSPRPSTPQRHETDLPPVLDYIPVSQGLHFPIDPQHKFDVFDHVRKKRGTGYSLHGEVTSPFDYFLDLHGHQEGLMALIDEPDRSIETLAHFTGLVRALAIEMCGVGVDAIKISSPFAGAGFISADFYEEFVMPFEQEIASAIRSLNVHCYLHTCGAIGDRLELMFETGVSGIECLDPPPLGDMELEEAKERTKGKGFIKGNVDSVNTLLRKSNVEILEDARKRIDVGRQDGGYILSTACSVAPHVQREKLLLLRQAVELWG